MEQELDPGLVEHLERGELELLGVERHRVAGRHTGRERAAGRDQPAEQAGERAGDHRLARPVVGREQLGGTRLLERGPLGVERHQRHDQRCGRVAAEEAVALGEDDPGAGLGRAQRRADAGRPAADHEDVDLGGDQGGARRQGDGRRMRGSGQRRHRLVRARGQATSRRPVSDWVSRRTAIWLLSSARARSAGSARAIRPCSRRRRSHAWST